MMLTKNTECKEGKECPSDPPPSAVNAPDGAVSCNRKASASPSVPVDCSNGEGEHYQGDVAEETVRLISSEGKHVDVPLRIAKECELLDRMLSGDFAESRTRELTLPDIRYRTLCKVVDYLRRRCHWRDGGGAPLEFEVDDDIAVDLLIAADYLGLK